MTVRDANNALPIVREQIAHERGCLRSFETVVNFERQRHHYDEVARLIEGRQPHWDRLQRLCKREDALIALICGEKA